MGARDEWKPGLRKYHVLLALAVLSSSAACQSTLSPADSVIRVADVALAEVRYGEVIRLLSSVPSDSLPSRGLFLLGSAYAAVNDAEPAVENLRRAALLERGNVQYRYHLARVLSATGSTAEAEREYATILGVDSQFVQARFQLGLALLGRRDFSSARDHFLAVLRVQPRDILALYHVGTCYANLDSIERAKTHFAACLTLNSRYGPALAELASLYYRGSDYQQALRLYRRAVREYPDQAEYWYNLGLCQEKVEDVHAAKESFREAVHLDTTNSLYAAHLGQVYFEIGQYDSAATAYATASRLDDGNPVLLLNLGLTFARMGNTPGAERAMHEAIAAYEPEKIAKVFVQLGALYYTNSRHREARRAYQSALLYDPANLEAQFYLAVTLDHLKEFPKAKEMYRKYLAGSATSAAPADKVKMAKRRVAEIP